MAGFAFECGHWVWANCQAGICFHARCTVNLCNLLSCGNSSNMQRALRARYRTNTAPLQLKKRQDKEGRFRLGLVCLCKTATVLRKISTNSFLQHYL